MSYQEDLILSIYNRGEPGLAMGNIPPGKGGSPGQPYEAPKEDPKHPYVPAPKPKLAGAPNFPGGGITTTCGAFVDISGEASSWFVEKRELYKGIANNHSFCETNEGIFWFNEFGAYLYDGEEIKNLFSTNEEESVNRINLENWNTFISSESICGFNPKSREVFVVKKTTHSSEADGDCYVYNLMTKSWVKGANKFFTGGKITNLINAGDLRKIGFFTSTDPGTSGVPKGETDNPGVPF